MLDESKKVENVPSEASENLSPESQKDEGKKEIFCKYITKNGKRIYPKNGKFFHFFI